MTNPTTTPVKTVASSAEAKVVAAIPAILGLLFIIHPGWKSSLDASAIEGAVSELLAGAIYLVNLVTARKL